MPAAPKAAQQLEMSFDFTGLSDATNLLAKEVASWLRISQDTVYDLCTAGELEAHRGTGDRSKLRITRRSVLAYHARTAQYEPADYFETVVRLVNRLGRDQRLQLRNHLLTSL